MRSKFFNVLDKKSGLAQKIHIHVNQTYIACFTNAILCLVPVGHITLHSPGGPAGLHGEYSDSFSSIFSAVLGVLGDLGGFERTPISPTPQSWGVG